MYKDKTGKKVVSDLELDCLSNEVASLITKAEANFRVIVESPKLEEDRASVLSLSMEGSEDEFASPSSAMEEASDSEGAAEEEVELSANQQRIACLLGGPFEEKDFPLWVRFGEVCPMLSEFEVEGVTDARDYLVNKAGEVEMKLDESDYAYLFRLTRAFYQEPEDSSNVERFQERVSGMNALLVQQPIAFSKGEKGFPVYANTKLALDTCVELAFYVYGPYLKALEKFEKTTRSGDGSFELFAAVWARLERLLDAVPEERQGDFEGYISEPQGQLWKYKSRTEPKVPHLASQPSLFGINVVSNTSPTRNRRPSPVLVYERQAAPFKPFDGVKEGEPPCKMGNFQVG